MPRQTIKRITHNIHVQGDFLVFGYGGLYQKPKGWGMDIAYINREDFKGIGAKKYVKERIKKKVALFAKSNILTELFIPNFLSRLQHVSYNEWHFEKCQIMFEHVRFQSPFDRYDNFLSFAAECIGASQAKQPDELEHIIRKRILQTLPKYDIEGMIKPHAYLLARRAEEVMREVFIDSFGSRDGNMLFEKIYKANNGHISLNAERYENTFFQSDAFIGIISEWHQKKMKRIMQDAYIDKVIKRAKVRQNKDKQIPRAKKDTRKAMREQHHELIMLLEKLDTPIFIATDDNANYFENFFLNTPMIAVKNSIDLQRYTVFGLCMYQRYALGGVIMTHGGRSYERFWHTLTEEITHLADGPKDRIKMRGHHRYSGPKAFERAYKKDRKAIVSWDRTGVFGVKEWGQMLTLRKVGFAKRKRILKAIERYDAALDFDHYAPEERAAEIFAALPIIEKAVGERLARKIMPSLFAYYDDVYLPGLKKEVKTLDL